MGKSSLSYLVVITFSFSVFEICVACSDGSNDNLKSILGRNINLTCNTNYQCNRFQWDKPTLRGVLQPSGELFQVGYSKSYLLLSGIRIDDGGSYRCYCHASSSVQEICQVHLKTICQATVILNGRRNVYNNSLPNSHFIDVNAGETIGIECSQGATFERGDCDIATLQESNELSNYTFEVLQEHNSCSIECLLRSRDGDSCSVGLTLIVTRLETSTPHSTSSTIVSTSTRSTSSVPTTLVIASDKPSVNQSTSTNVPNWQYTTMPAVQQMEKDNAVPDKSGSFPVMLLIGISIVVFVGILSIICFFIYFSRSNSTSRQKKTQNIGNESLDSSIPIGPTYATVNKSSPGCTKDNDDSERGIPCTDDAYAEVNSAMNEESSAQQVSAVKTETPITKDYYSVVNTFNTKLEPMDHGNESDSALYTEVNKEVKQGGKKLSPSSPESSDCNPNVPDVQSYDVLEQPESSEYDAVGVVSTSQAIYAVVDKEEKKE